MDVIKKTYTIDNIETRRECSKQVNFLDTTKNFVVCILKKDKLKTITQCALFHTLLKDFVDIANSSGLGGVLDNNIGWWKYQIKVKAQFYDTKKGHLFTTEKAREINEELKKIRPDIKKLIIEAMTMNVKSIANATTKELSILIKYLYLTIIDNLPIQLIMDSELLTQKLIEEKNNLAESFNKDTAELDQELFEKLTNLFS